MPWVTIGNVRGPRGFVGPPGDPLNVAGWKFLKENFDALDGTDLRAPVRGDFFDDDLVGLAAQDGRATWLGARRSDGGPTDHGLWMIADRLGIGFDPSDGFLIALTDAAGRHTDVELRLTDGRFTDRVVDGLAPRIADRIGGGSSGSGLTPGDRMLDSTGKLVSVFPDTKTIYGWGSSSMQGIGPFFESSLASTGATFHNQGKSGEVSDEIFARLGSRPALITVAGGTVPASGPVTVTASNMASTQYLKPFTGTLLGLPGTLAWSGTVMAFTRTTPGTAFTVPAGTPFIPDLAAPAKGSVAFLWAGKNNVTSPTVGTRSIEQTDQAFDWFAPLVKRILVMGHFVDSDVESGSVRRTNVLSINAAHKARYGNLFLDIAAYLASAQLWIDAGITPTSTDLAQQADGVIPVSVSENPSHLNGTGYTAVVKFARRHLAALGWY